MQPVGPKAATTSITRLPNLVKGINNLAKGINNLNHEVLSLMKGIDNLNHEVLNLMKGIDNLNHEVLNLVKGIDNLDHEVLNLVNEVAQLVKIAKNRVELAPDIPSLTSTDKSVCATPALPVASLMLVKQDLWHRHSCLCFGKLQHLLLITDSRKELDRHGCAFARRAGQ